MRRNLVVAAVAVATLLGTAACGGGSNNTSDTGSTTTTSPSGSAPADTPAALSGTVKVWTMQGSVPDDLQKQFISTFEAANPGVTVDWQVQQWNGIQEKLNTAMSSKSSSPDVVELGNTQAPGFAASGALSDLSDKVADLNGSDWIEGLKATGVYDGKQYAIPFYAANRVVIYRTDMFAQAGVMPPTSWAEWDQVNAKLQAKFASTKNFAAHYLPGQNWYFWLSLLWAEGGDLLKDGKGAINSPEAVASLKDYKDLFDHSGTSAAKAGTDEANPQVYQVLAADQTAQIVALPWDVPAALKDNPKLQGKLAAFPIPGKTAGTSAPVFLGGSNLAIPANAPNPDAAYAFLKYMNGKDFQEALAAKNLLVPGSKSYTSVLSSDPFAKVMAEAAANGSNTPSDPNWGKVEAGQNPFKQMLTKVLRGGDPQQAADEANNALNQLLGS